MNACYGADTGNMAASNSFFLQFPCQSIMCHLLAITTYLYEYFFTSLSQFPLIVSWVYTWFKLQCIDKPVYTVRTHYMQAFSGPNCFILFCLMMNLFEGHFLHEQRLWCIFLSMWNGGSIVPWGKLHSANQSSCDPLCLFKSLSYKLNFADHVCDLLVLFNEVWLMPSFALLKWNLAYSLVFADLSMGSVTAKPKWLDKLLVFVNIEKMTVLYMCFYVIVEYFLPMKFHLSRQSDCLFISKFEVMIKW